MSGCGILEHWTSARGGHGTSLNFYDRRTKTWSQAWIDEGGNALHLSGTFADGKMVLASAPRKTDAGVDVQRITWSKKPDATVRQLWESSSDGGRTWTVAFAASMRHTVRRASDATRGDAEGTEKGVNRRNGATETNGG